MIRFLRNNECEYLQCNDIWQNCFGDDKGFTDYYFARRVSPNIALCDIDENGLVRGMLFTIPKTLMVDGNSYRATLIAGVAVRQEFRHIGIATDLLLHAEKHLRESGCDIAFLSPQNEEVTALYSKLKYERLPEYHVYTVASTCVKEEKQHPTAEFMHRVYEKNVRKYHGYLRRDKSDFRAMIEEFSLNGGVMAHTDNAYAAGYDDDDVCNIQELCGDVTEELIYSISRVTTKEVITFTVPSKTIISAKITRLDSFSTTHIMAKWLTDKSIPLDDIMIFDRY